MISTLILITTLPLMTEASELLLNSYAPAPGETLAVFLEGHSNPKRVELRFRDKSYPFYAAGSNRLRALIGLTAKAEPGPATVTVVQRRWLFPDKKWQADVAVAGRVFAEQSIKMPQKKIKMAGTPKAKAAVMILRNALKRESEAQLWRGIFQAPVPGRISSVYGQPRKLNRTKSWDWHRGIDIAAPAGTSVAAPNDGIVVLSGRYPLQGGTIVIDHGQGVMSVLMHLKTLKAKTGDTVAKGDKIATVGSEGFSTGAHVHWGVYVHRDPVDPQPWLEKEF